MNTGVSKGKEPTRTDAEACAYLYTVGLTAPMDHDCDQVYLHVAGKTYSRDKGNYVPGDIRVESLNDCQAAERNGLKAWLYQQRVKTRQEGDRADRRQEREEIEAKRETEQPALFEF